MALKAEPFTREWIDEANENIRGRGGEEFEYWDVEQLKRNFANRIVHKNKISIDGKTHEIGFTDLIDDVRVWVEPFALPEDLNLTYGARVVGSEIFIIRSLTDG